MLKENTKGLNKGLCQSWNPSACAKPGVFILGSGMIKSRAMKH